MWLCFWELTCIKNTNGSCCKIQSEKVWNDVNLCPNSWWFSHCLMLKPRTGRQDVRKKGKKINWSKWLANQIFLQKPQPEYLSNEEKERNKKCFGKGDKSKEQFDGNLFVYARMPLLIKCPPSIHSITVSWSVVKISRRRTEDRTAVATECLDFVLYTKPVILFPKILGKKQGLKANFRMWINCDSVESNCVMKKQWCSWTE